LKKRRLRAIRFPWESKGSHGQLVRYEYDNGDMVPMSNSNKLAKAVTAKFAESDFQRLRFASERTGKRPAEWCRERVLENLNGIRPSPAQQAILAEILALQDTLVGLICALGRDGRLTPQKAKEIVDAAHERKYRDVAALFKDAEAECRRSAR